MFSDHLLCHVSSSSPSFGLLLFCSKGTTERKLIHQQELGVFLVLIVHLIAYFFLIRPHLTHIHQSSEHCKIHCIQLMEIKDITYILYFLSHKYLCLW